MFNSAFGKTSQVFSFYPGYVILPVPSKHSSGPTFLKGNESMWEME